MEIGQAVEILKQISILLELKGENPFKSRAYVTAARTLESTGEPLDKLVADGRLGDLPGIGEAIQKKLTELVMTGHLKYYEELKASIPAGLLDMLQIPGLGPRKIKALHEKLGITTIAELEAACKSGKVAELAGFGEKTAANICEGINRRRNYSSRHLLIHGWLIAEPLLENLREHPDVAQCSAAGSVRRFKEVIGDIDLLASSRNPSAVIEFFTSLPGILRVQAKGDTKASVVLEGGVQADLRVVSDAEYPFALMYFTGSKEHNIILRQRAIERGLRLNEYGLFKSKEETRDPKLLVACDTEEEIYDKLGLACIPPELREDMGEIAAAEQRKLPRLVEWTEIRGSLHNHSTWSDGHNRPEDIVRYMDDLGFDYWGITDHSKSSWQAKGVDEKKLGEEIVSIRELNEKLQAEGVHCRLLTGIEVDILANGKLDIPDELLAQLDVVVASIHQAFTQSEAEITKRLIAAAQNKYVHTIGHLTGRLLLDREGYKVNARAVIDACAETNTWIELNVSPNRLDMDWRHWPYARSKGVKCVINCDGHRNEHAQFLRLGVGTARKGWLTKEDVLNTLPLPELMKALKVKRRS